MSRHLNRILFSGALAMMLSVGAHAQTNQLPDVDQGNDNGVAPAGICGTTIFNDGKEREALANTARINPELYQQIRERSKQSTPRAIQSTADDGIVLSFLMRNRVTGAFDQVQARLVYDGVSRGRHARIWLDLLDTGRIKATTIAALAKGLDSVTTGKSRNTGKSIMENDVDVFGAPPMNRFDNTNSCDFLLTDIKDNIPGAFVAGFFSPWDQTDNDGSNKMNILYIDSHEGLGNQSSGNIADVLGTLAHEYQHLIHYNTNNQSETMYNEGCSEVASILNGYQDRANTNFLKNTNVPMFTWDYDDGGKILADYERGLTFVHYLYEQYGENFLTTFNRTHTRGMDRLQDALRAMGNNDDWKDILSNFVAANYLRTFSAPYGYVDKLSNATPALTVNATTNLPDTGSAAVQQYASVYTSYSKTGPFKVTFHASLPMRVMAMLYKGSTAVEVWQLDKDSTYMIGGNGNTYDKVVFGVVNLYSSSQTIRWNMESVTLGVNDEKGTTGGLAVNSITPNPAYGPVTIDFTTAVAGPTTVQIYDTRGALVRTLADGERYEAGTHQLAMTTEGMASGPYMVRVSQANHSVSQVMVVTR